MGGESSARDTMGGILPLTPRAPEGPGSAAVVGGRVRTVRVDLVGPVVVLGEPVPVVAGLLRGRAGLPVQPLRLGAGLLGPDLALARGAPRGRRAPAASGAPARGGAGAPRAPPPPRPAPPARARAAPRPPPAGRARPRPGAGAAEGGRERPAAGPLVGGWSGRGGA